MLTVGVSLKVTIFSTYVITVILFPSDPNLITRSEIANAKAFVQAGTFALNYFNLYISNRVFQPLTLFTLINYELKGI